jgi:hypothetical protein
MSKKGIKLLVVAKEAVGKTTLISKIKNSLVAATDNKAFAGKVPHFRVGDYQGLTHLIDTINTKVGVYKEKYGELPKTITIDSVTHLANNIERYCNKKYTGYNVYANFGKDVLEFNHYLETTILPTGINVVLTSHCQYNQDTGRWEIAAPGNFGKNGSWLSVVGNSIFIEIKANKRIVHTNSMKFPARTDIDMPESTPLEDYDINEHLQKLHDSSVESAEFLLD